MMAYFAPYIDGDGIHIPTYQDILDNLIEGYKRIFGEDLYLGEDTQDYQMLSLFAKAQDDMMALVTQNYAARNPNYATGDALDLLVALNAMNRKKATASSATLTLGGTPYSTIPLGSKAIDQSGYLWTLQADISLDMYGVGTVEAKCDTLGSITANAGTIDTIYSPVFGWTTVTNAAPAVPGQDTETDEELRVRRNKSVSMNTNGTYDALLRALLSLNDVEFADLRVNDTSETDELGIPGHSFCALVSGGDADEIVKQIWLNKAPGVGTHGNTTKTYIDDSGNENTIKFTIPTKVLTSVAVSLTPTTGYDAARCEDLISNAIQGNVNSLGVGESWSVTTAYRDIYNVFGEEKIPFIINSITGTNTVTTTSSTTVVTCDYDQILYTDAEHITITTT